MPEPRIPPVEPPYTPETAEMLAKWMPPGAAAEPLLLFRTLAVHPDLAARMRPLGAAVLGHPRLLPRDRELLILRTCARAGAEYEWGVHAVAFGAAVGLDEAQIVASANGAPADPAFTPADAALIAAADELHDTAALSQRTWEALASRLDQVQLLELTVVCGWYRLISYVINAAGVQLETWAARFPAA